MLTPLAIWPAILFVAASRPGYDHVRQYVSELAVGPNGNIVTGGLFALAALTLVFALGLAVALGRDRLAWIAAALLCARAAALVLVGVFVGDVDPTQPTITGRLHNIFVGLNSIALAGACLALTVRFARSPEWRPLAGFTFATGLLTIAATGILATATPQGTGALDAPLARWAGLIQRTSITVGTLWSFVLGLALVRREGKPSATPPALMPARG